MKKLNNIAVDPYVNSTDSFITTSASTIKPNTVWMHADTSRAHYQIPCSDMGSVDINVWSHPKVPGSFIQSRDKTINRVSIKKVIYSEPATIVFWSDNTKTVCKCVKPDVYSPEKGLTMCIVKKLNENRSLLDMFMAWLPSTHHEEVTLKEARRRMKQKIGEDK